MQMHQARDQDIAIRSPLTQTAARFVDIAAAAPANLIEQGGKLHRRLGKALKRALKRSITFHEHHTHESYKGML